jgi:ribosomal protein L29
MSTAKKPAQKAPATKAKEAKTVLSLADLEKELQAKQADLLTTTRPHKAGELTNPRALRALRREIARINTAITAQKGVK